MADLVRGVVRGALVIGDDGARLGTPLWAGDYTPVEGDPVMVLSQDGLAYILGPASTVPRPQTGTVTVAAAGGRVGVLAGGVTYSARYTDTAPTVAQSVHLMWDGSAPTVIGLANATITGSPDGGADPGAPVVSKFGTLPVAAVDSGAWRSSDGWGTSTSRPVSTRAVLQYTYTGSNPYSGAWFYGNRAAQLAGATVTAIRIYIPGRLVIGSYNSSLSAHLYLHTASGKPAGDVTRTLGPSDQTLVGVPSTLGWVTLPIGWAATLVAGGGVGIYGTPYLGVNGIDADPASGQLSIDWSR